MTVVSEELINVFNMGKEEIEREFSPYFFHYNRAMFDSPEASLEAYSEHYKCIFDIIQGKGKRILDLGCGFGISSIQFAVFGAQLVNAIDANEEKIEIFQKILQRFNPPLNNLEIKLADALSLKYGDNYFDSIVADEVISHVRDLNKFIQETHRVLRKGGVCYISDGNNALDIRSRHHRRQWWRTWEYGPIAESIRRGTDNPLPWLYIRRQMIEEKCSDFEPKVLDFLAKETAGMYGQQILQAVDDYLQKGRVLNKPSFKFKNPETGEFNEFEFNPFRLKKQLEDNGFSVQILKPSFQITSYHSISAILRNLAIHGIKIFHPMSLLVAPRFEILARKL